VRLPAELLGFSIREQAVYDAVATVASAGFGEREQDGALSVPKHLAEAAVLQAISLDPCQLRGGARADEPLSAVFASLEQKRAVCARLLALVPSGALKHPGYVAVRSALHREVLERYLEPAAGDLIQLRAPASGNPTLDRAFELIPVRDVVNTQRLVSEKVQYTATDPSEGG
jgi:hypothetical protein